MRRFVFIVLALASVAALLSGCSSGRYASGPSYQPPKWEEWRGETERACLRSTVFARNPYVESRSSLGGSGIGGCGAIQPFVVRAADNGRVPLNPPATLRCPMIPAMDDWVRDVLSPAAIEHLGSPITGIKVISSYSCRPINGQGGGQLSEHGRANAIDIAAFTVADGRMITVKRGWNGWSQDEARFLRAIHRGACRVFTTVLGPDANAWHHDHFHFDLARHGRDGTFRVCK